MRELSSSLTWFHKFAFPTLWIGGFAIGTLIMFIGPHSLEEEVREMRWLFLGLTVIGTLFLYWFCMRLKRVRLSGGALLISNYRTELEVPLRDVEVVSGSLLVKPELIWLRFRRPTAF